MEPKKKKKPKKKLVLLGIVVVILLLAGGLGNRKKSVGEGEDVEEKETYKEFIWPKSDIAKMIPAPKSNVGLIKWEASYGICVYVAETSSDEYREYVDKCIEKGFDIDYHRTEETYYADNVDGYNVYVTYDEGNVMFIRLDAPEDETKKDSEKDENSSEKEPDSTNPESSSNDNTDSEPSESTQSTDTARDENDIDPDFKQAMDDYESFIDDYITFMEKYQGSDDVLSMASDYSDYMNKYVELSEKMDSLNQDELTIAEAQYYAEVMARISQKLMNVSVAE